MWEPGYSDWAKVIELRTFQTVFCGAWGSLEKEGGRWGTRKGGKGGFQVPICASARADPLIVSTSVCFGKESHCQGKKGEKKVENHPSSSWG